MANPIARIWSAATKGEKVAAAVARAAPHAESTFARLGGLGGKGAELRRAANLGSTVVGGGKITGRTASGAAAHAELLALGRRRAMYGGGAAGGLALLGHQRSSGISSGVNGTQPQSMGGYTGY